jgi:hypothetical protein
MPPNPIPQPRSSTDRAPPPLAASRINHSPTASALSHSSAQYGIRAALPCDSSRIDASSTTRGSATRVNSNDCPATTMASVTSSNRRRIRASNFGRRGSSWGFLGSGNKSQAIVQRRGWRVQSRRARVRLRVDMSTRSVLASAAACVALCAMCSTAGCGKANQLETGYVVRPLNASPAEIRGFYAERFTPAARAAALEREQEMERRRPTPGY